MWPDIKVRYKQTALGAIWAVIQPLVTMIVFTYFFGKFAKVPSEECRTRFFLYRIVALDFFHQRRQQWCQQPHRQQPDHQGLLSEADHPVGRNRGRIA